MTGGKGGWIPAPYQVRGMLSPVWFQVKAAWFDKLTMMVRQVFGYAHTKSHHERLLCFYPFSSRSLR
jgi:hypothetical protein